MLLTAVVGGALSFFAVVHLSSHESGTGAADTPRLPVTQGFSGCPLLHKKLVELRLICPAVLETLAKSRSGLSCFVWS